MTTEEKNVPIAKFMGLVHHYKPSGKEFWEEGIDIYYKKLKYHKSWKWLMPVVRKIVELCIADETGDLFESEYYNSILDTVPLADIESAHRVVWEFIEWYTKNKEA